MAYSRSRFVFVCSDPAPEGRGHVRVWGSEGPLMKLVRVQAFRVLLALCTLASSALVIEAGQRWR